MAKSIVITDSEPLINYFKKVFRQNDFDLEKEPLLHDVNAIKNNIKTNHHTGDIRTAFGSHIKQYGIPPLLVLDYFMDLGLHKELDPDQRKLLRTFIIAYAILLQGKGYIRKNNFIVLVGDEKTEHHLKLFRQQPHYLFKLVKTENPQVNSFLDKYAKDPDLTNQFFKIDYIIKPRQSVIQGQLHKIVDLVTVVKRIIAIESVVKDQHIPAGDKAEEANVSGKAEVPDFLYRVSDDKLFFNGEMINYNKQDHGELLLNVLYLKGYWNSMNQMKVSDNISDLFQSKIKPYWEKSVEDPQKSVFSISMYLGDEISVEPEITGSMLQLLENKLKKMGEVSLYISPKNRQILKNASGFKLLESYVLRNI